MSYTQWILPLTILILVILLWTGGAKMKEGFEDVANQNLFKIVSKHSGKAVELYNGTIETSLVVNDIKDDSYGPQTWTQKGDNIVSVATGKYLTITPDRTKVYLDNPDPSKQQLWEVREDAIRNKNDTRYVLAIEGGSKDANALVIVKTQTNRPEEGWTRRPVVVPSVNRIIVVGEKDGKVAQRIPNADLQITSPILASSFTYSFWLWMDKSDYRNGEWKHILNKGTENADQRSPGIWVHTTEPRLHIRMTTATSNSEGIEKTTWSWEPEQWYYITVTVSGKVLTFYVNGIQSQQMTLTTAPIINQGDLFLSQKGGFAGRIKDLFYANRVLTLTEIKDYMNRTNPEKSCADVKPQNRDPDNLAPNISGWTPTRLTRFRTNEECIPEQPITTATGTGIMGGDTVSFTLDAKAVAGTGTAALKATLDRPLMSGEKYRFSVWVRNLDDSRTVAVRFTWRPSSAVDESKTESSGWITTRTAQWEEVRTEFVPRADDINGIGIEFNQNSSEPTRASAYLPTLRKVAKPKPVDASAANIPVIRYGSNGTLRGCNTDEVGINDGIGWCALKPERGVYYLEAVFDDLYDVRSIHLRGRGDYPHWTTEYRVEYWDIYQKRYIRWGSQEEQELPTSVPKGWMKGYSKRRYEGYILPGNRNTTDVVQTKANFQTMRVRIYPMSFQGYPSLRVGFGGTPSKPNKCMEYQVGMRDMTLKPAERAAYKKRWQSECERVSRAECDRQVDRLKRQVKGLEKQLLYGGPACTNLPDTIRDDQYVNEKCEVVAKGPDQKKHLPNYKALMETNQQNRERIAQLLRKIEELNKRITGLQKRIAGGSTSAADRTAAESASDQAKRKIVALETELQRCQANFTGVHRETFEDAASSNTARAIVMNQLNAGDTDKKTPKDTTEGFADRSTSDLARGGADHTIDYEQPLPEDKKEYDITKHKQYAALMSQIEGRLRQEYDDQKIKDIREHEDFQKVVKYVYDQVREQYRNNYVQRLQTIEQKYKAMVRNVMAGAPAYEASQKEQLKELVKATARKLLKEGEFDCLKHFKPVKPPVVIEKYADAPNGEGPVKAGRETREGFESASPFRIENHTEYQNLMANVVPRSQYDQALKEALERTRDELAQNNQRWQERLEEAKSGKGEVKQYIVKGSVQTKEMAKELAEQKTKYERIIQQYQKRSECMKKEQENSISLAEHKRIVDQAVKRIQRQLTKRFEKQLMSDYKTNDEFHRSLDETIRRIKAECSQRIGKQYISRDEHKAALREVVKQVREEYEKRSKPDCKRMIQEVLLPIEEHPDFDKYILRSDVPDLKDYILRSDAQKVYGEGKVDPAMVKELEDLRRQVKALNERKEQCASKYTSRPIHIHFDALYKLYTRIFGETQETRVERFLRRLNVAIERIEEALKAETGSNTADILQFIQISIRGGKWDDATIKIVDEVVSRIAKSTPLPDVLRFLDANGANVNRLLAILYDFITIANERDRRIQYLREERKRLLLIRDRVLEKSKCLKDLSVMIDESQLRIGMEREKVQRMRTRVAEEGGELSKSERDFRFLLKNYLSELQRFRFRIQSYEDETARLRKQYAQLELECKGRVSQLRSDVESGRVALTIPRIGDGEWSLPRLSIPRFRAPDFIGSLTMGENQTGAGWWSMAAPIASPMADRIAEMIVGGFGGQSIDTKKPDSTPVVAPTPQSTQGTNAVPSSVPKSIPQDTPPSISKMNPTQQSFGWDWQSGVQSTLTTLQRENPVHPGTHWNWSQPTSEVNTKPVKTVLEQAEKKAEHIQCLDKKADGYLTRIGSFFGMTK